MSRGLFKHVLVPHDFTAAADDALRTAVALAAREDGDVTVLHVIAPFYPLRDLAYGPQLLDARAVESQMLARLERHVGSLAAANGVHCEVTTGNPGQRIASAAANASCVVMPTSGRIGVAHALMGSVAERVARLSPVPVLILPSTRARTGRRTAVKRRRPHGR
jgi:nucleotide-binding universal stress UspA family protein